MATFSEARDRWSRRLARLPWRAAVWVLLLSGAASAGAQQSTQVQFEGPQGGAAPLPAPPMLEALPQPNVLPPACPVPPQGAAQDGGPGVPRPSAKVLKEYERFIEKTVEPENVLELIVGIRKVMVFKDPPKRIQTDDEKGAVVAADPITPRELSLVGKKVGKAVLYLWFADPKAPNQERILSYLIRVRPDTEAAEQARQAKLQADRRAQNVRQQYYKDLEQKINCAFPDSHVTLTLVGTSLLLCGDAHDTVQATQILRILQPMALNQGQGLGTPTLLTSQGLLGSQSTIIPPLAPVQPEAPPPAPPELTQVEFQPNDQGAQPPKAVLPGLIPVPVAVGPDTTATGQAAAAGRFRINVVNLLRIPGEQQVMLKVVVAEVNRSAARSLGVNFSIANKEGIKVFSNLTGGLLNTSLATLTSTGTIGGNLPTILDNGQIAIAINALKTVGLARSLAEPNLTAMNGQPASFQAGSEFPVPVVTGYTAAGLQGVQYVPLGVQVSFLPTITDKDRIRLQVNATVSTVNPSLNATINGTVVPGLDDRTFNTVVELREGQTLAVAGLIKNDLASSSNRIPFLGDLPFIGQFTGTNNTQIAEQELVMLVTPVLVHPLDHNERPPLPGADMFEPNDVEFFLVGHLESRRPYDYRSPAMTDIHRMIRYHHCEQIYIIGPSGHSEGTE